jgi:hypothetical protein
LLFELLCLGSTIFRRDCKTVFGGTVDMIQRLWDFTYITYSEEQ